MDQDKDILAYRKAAKEIMNLKAEDFFIDTSGIDRVVKRVNDIKQKPEIDFHEYKALLQENAQLEKQLAELNQQQSSEIEKFIIANYQTPPNIELKQEEVDQLMTSIQYQAKKQLIDKDSSKKEVWKTLVNKIISERLKLHIENCFLIETVNTMIGYNIPLEDIAALEDEFTKAYMNYLLQNFKQKEEELFNLIKDIQIPEFKELQVISLNNKFLTKQDMTFTQNAAMALLCQMLFGKPEFVLCFALKAHADELKDIQ